MRLIKLFGLFLLAASFIASTSADTSALSFFEPEERALMFEFRRGKKKGGGGGKKGGGKKGGGGGGKKRGGGGGKKKGGGGGGGKKKPCPPPPPPTTKQKVKAACKTCAKAVGGHLKEHGGTYVAAGVSAIIGACVG